MKGAIKNTGVHAGGIIISSKEIANYFQVAKAQSDSAVLPVIQIEMNDVETNNLLKLDGLGLNSLNQIGTALELIGDELPKAWFDLEDFTDPKVYDFLRKGNTVNVFQMQKPQATQILKNIKVNNLDDLSIANAAVRPGLSNPTPIYNNRSPLDIYIDIKDGKRRRDYYSGDIDKILDKTEGVIWFQEDCQKIGQIMAGYSLGSADTRIRKTIAKGKKDKIPEIRNEFIYGKESLYDDKHNVVGISEVNSKLCPGAINRGYSEEIAIKIFALIEAMAKYCFDEINFSVIY